MKKLLMSMVAVAVMSSASFAKTGEKTTANKVAETTKVYSAVAGNSNMKIVGEAEEIKKGKKVLCRLTVKVYNEGGILMSTNVHTYTSYGASDMFFTNCGQYFSHMMESYNNYLN
ncbi:putative cupredoxin-like copper-binding protein [Pedobacter africanus]|uniref:Cupredoxin-like copper-binding protein n=1 Tax=Pedobacter africanus TaxID=151894 RepID=A0ACC6KS31_9SPHI|nr:hypothetical protein [Pedobacter africanus]MDR6781965.1 putative cupredoxin-like copper-binding protein [Pedobacter africanus]